MPELELQEYRYRDPEWEWNPKTLSLKLGRKRPPLGRLIGKLELLREPKVSGPTDLSDLWAPGQTRPIDLPGYYLARPVHSMEGLGWMHPRMGGKLEKMTRDFPFNAPQIVGPWLQRNLVDAGIRPKRILDVGTGAGTTAFYYAEVFPEAEVVGIDIAPNLLRWAKKRAKERGFDNVRFYHADSGDLRYFEDESFDVVHQAHVLHEMPAEHQRKTVREMVRVCKTGGFLGFFDRGIAKTEADWKVRQWYVQSTQEPFLLEYDRFNWPDYVATVLECPIEENPKFNKNWRWDGSSTSWAATKSETANQRLRETEDDPAEWERLRYAEDAPIKWSMVSKPR